MTEHIVPAIKAGYVAGEYGEAELERRLDRALRDDPTTEDVTNALYMVAGVYP